MSEQSQLRKCFECGYETANFLVRCPMCNATLIERELSVDKNVVEQNSRSFSLSTLFLMMTLICVSLGAIVTAPGLGIPFVVLVIPAFVRTTFATRRTTSASGRWTRGERIAKFTGSLSLMLLIGVAGVIAFQVACWSSCWGVAVAGGGENAAFLTGLWVGGGAGVLAIGWLLWKTWPKQKR